MQDDPIATAPGESQTSPTPDPHASAAAPVLRCPVVGCDAELRGAGSVFCESGEWDGNHYAAEGDADVYECANGHIFAFDLPEDDSEGDE